MTAVARRLVRFRSLQQKLGFYSLLVSLVALAAVSLLSYRVARSQVQANRVQLMGIEKDQIAQELEDELKNAARDIQLWGEMEVVQASLKHPDSKQTQAFLDDQLKHQPKYDLIFAVDAQGRLAAVNTIAAAVLGEPYKSILPEIRESWLQTVLEGGTVQGTDWAQLTFVNQLYGRNQQNSPPENR